VNVFAIILDTRPAYLADSGGATSLLLAPLGRASVLAYLRDRLDQAGHSRIGVASDFAPEPEYVRAMARTGTGVGAVVWVRELATRLDEYEPSDWLVIVDPRCVPSSGLGPGALRLEADAGPRRVRHLVALEHHPGGTTERVQLGADGTVGRIQRYYDSATWPFTSGVACSVVPVSCMVGAGDLAWTSLRELRRGLAERGVPSNDVFVRGGAFDLTRERDLLALSERVVLEHFSGGREGGAPWPDVAAGCAVDPTARLVGPVILQDGAVLAADAVVIGPAVIGARAHVDRGSTVAQCVVGPDARVAPGLTLRHRALFGAVDAPGAAVTPAPLGGPAQEAAMESPEMAFEVEDDGASSPAGYPLVKAAFDVIAAALGLVLLSPLLLVVAALIKLESTGPVLHRGRREGKGGRLFDCLKFRTMRAGADAQQRELYLASEVDGPQFKMAHDPRVTRLGAVLRALNLDELPQLVNVLRLEMSLVGPRPSPFRENQLCVPWRDARLSVRPGITGLWQVCRHHRAEGDFHQWIHFDLLYVQHMSFRVDLEILAATVATLGGHWPVPLGWIVSSRHRDGSAPMPAIASVPSGITPKLDGRTT
jgi:lipopolysaccharide/colanic/teichoic acid biosynthesis glycosyltransferase